MAMARKEGKPKRNRKNIVKLLKKIKRNQELLNSYKS